ncbi:hypothetical protein A3H38_03900, partial [candidate division WOR-1 bacterium RIFCSPLOWO2_02_FULL_46_20]
MALEIEIEVKSRSCLNLSNNFLIISYRVIIAYVMRFILALSILISIVTTLAFPSSEDYNPWKSSYDSVKAETIKSYRKGSIQVEEIYYQSRLYNGQPSKIFGYYCYPADFEQELPAIIISHGGGGTASLARTITWANRGYAVLAIDLPGKGEQRASSRSTGPNMDVPTLLRTTPNIEDNYLIHSVAAIRNGITYLTQRAEVDAGRIGLVGLSWGGVNTILTNGQDKRLKTAVNVFGAGYIPEGCTWQTRFDIMTDEELALWDKYIDPKNFLTTQHAPILFITGTNDHCYYLPTFQKSYNEVTAPKKLVLIPNLKHQFTASSQKIVWRWLDLYLKYEGSFPEVKILSLHKKGNDKVVISASATSGQEISDVTLYYTQSAPTAWTKQKWVSLTPYQEDGVYYFGVPTSLIEPEMLFYIHASDIKNGTVSTPIRSIFRVSLKKNEDAYAVTFPIIEINKHTPPIKFVGIEDAPQFPQILFSKHNRS